MSRSASGILLLLITKGWGNTGLASMVHPRILVAIGYATGKSRGPRRSFSLTCRKMFQPCQGLLASGRSWYRRFLMMWPADHLFGDGSCEYRILDRRVEQGPGSGTLAGSGGWDKTGAWQLWGKMSEHDKVMWESATVATGHAHTPGGLKTRSCLLEASA